MFFFGSKSTKNWSNVLRDLDNLSVAVVGATGAVGREMISVLEQRELNFKEIRLFSSARSAGEVIKVKGKDITVEELKVEAIENIDIALFSAGSSISKEFGPVFADEGAIVIDNSSCFRMDEGVPLIVPEVNSDIVKQEIASGSPNEGMVIANPNCSTIQMMVVLKPILERAGIRRVVVSTYQSVSGAGKQAMDELFEQTRGIYNQNEVAPEAFPHQIAFNCIPQIDVFLENGYTKEEMKMVNETRKILSQPDMKITATAVRVPVFSCHSESINIETEQPLSAEEAKQLLAESPGVIVLDNPEKLEYPLAAELGGSDATYVGRIREDESVQNGLNMWVVADNLRKGAALNAVQIAEVVIDTWGQNQQ